MADKQKLKIKLGSFTTPFGVAVWPRLNTPDTKFKEEGQYKTDLLLSEKDIPAIQKKLEAWRDEALEKFREENPKKAKSIKAGRIPLVPETDKEGDETGNTLLRTTKKASGTRKDGSEWKAKIIFRDAKGNLVKKVPNIWGGSELRIAVTVFGYLGKTDNTVGITLEIDGVQIKKLVESTRDVKFDAVDDEDGWTPGGDDDASDDTDDDTSDDEDDDTPAF